MSAQTMTLLTVVLILLIMLWSVDGFKTAFFCMIGCVGISGFLYALLNIYTYMGFRLY